MVSGCQSTTKIVLPESVNTPILPTSTVTPSLTATVTTTPTLLRTATQLPSPTSTPRSHQVKLGETLGGIAWQYGVSLDSLLTMNPEVNPYAMSVGTTLLIPVETLPPTNQTPVPTMISMPVDLLNCTSMEDDGIWCFAWVNNIMGYALENVSINVNVADMAATKVTAQEASAPLNVLLSGEKMPFAVYFPPPMPQPFQFSAQFASAIPLDDPFSRYQKVDLVGVSININSQADMAAVSGTFEIQETTTSVRIVAAAINENGEIVGLRSLQIENEDSQSATNFEIKVYAAYGMIDEVLLFAEGQS